MPTNDVARSPSRSASKRIARLGARSKRKPRPTLEVDTTCTRHRGPKPQQVLLNKPAQTEGRRPDRQEPKFVSLKDVTALNPKYGPAKDSAARGWRERLHPGPQRALTGGKMKQSEGLKSEHAVIDVAAPGYSRCNDRQPRTRDSVQLPPLNKRIKGLKPSALNLNTDVSPSDRAIPIGIAIDADALPYHKYVSQSGASYPDSSPRQHINTPTIVITPAKEDFENGLTASPEEMRSGGSCRPRSSVYSRYTNGLPSRQYDRTPPVPPLPLFATEHASSVRTDQSSSSPLVDIDDPAPPYEETPRSNYASPFGSQGYGDAPVSQSAAATPRQSKGWWNVVTSPFSALGSAARSTFRSPTLQEEDEPEMQSLGSGASNMGGSEPRTGVTFSNRSENDDELRSAPPSSYTGRSFGTGIPTPQRSDTAPGALDFGNADEVNIYRPGSQGEASSYYDNDRNFPDTVGPASSVGTGRSMAPENWSPSHSVYRGSTGRGSDFALPTGGEADAYYNLDNRFSSANEPPSAGGIDRDLGDWSPSQSAYRGSMRGPSSGAFPGDGHFAASPSEMGRSDGARSFGGADNGPMSGYESNFGGGGTPMPGNDSITDPDMRDSYSHGAMGGQGPMSGMSGETPMSGASGMSGGYGGVAGRSSYGTKSDFNGFSATHPAADGGFPSARSDDAYGRQSSEGMQTGHGFPQHNENRPLSATPVLENARTATFTRPMSSHGELRQVDLDREGTPIRYGNGLASGTMTSRSVVSDEQSMRTTSKSDPYPSSAAYQSRDGQQRFSMSNGSSERGLYPPTRPVSEKPSFSSEVSAAYDNDDAEPRTPWYRRLFSKKPAHETVEDEEPLKKPLPSHDINSRDDRKDTNPRSPWYRRFIWIVAAIGPLLLLVLIVLLAMFIPTQENDMPVQANWLDLSGTPPMPTGVLTMVGAKVTAEENGCVSPGEMWSCDAPLDATGSTHDTGLNFRLVVAFKNGTVPSNETIPERLPTDLDRRGSSLTVHAGAVVRRTLWEGGFYSPSPPPPSTDDQSFVGRTTDNVEEPYNGEETPYCITLLNATSLGPAPPTRNRKRDDEFHYPYPTPTQGSSADTEHTTDDTSDASTDAAKSIPYPALTGDGEPETAELYPFVNAQPVRLFNRGQRNEHYGFSTYFDRSVYLSSMSSNGSGNSSSSAAKLLSNVPLEDAGAVCTWSQTRLHVQIWIRKRMVTSLNTTLHPEDITAVNSTANDMSAPGSFPYATTITLDRHGGDASKKAVYCYGLDEEHHVVQTSGIWIPEDRAFNGKLINPANVPGLNSTSLSRRDYNQGSGIDGGDGGCSCQWQNRL